MPTGNVRSTLCTQCVRRCGFNADRREAILINIGGIYKYRPCSSVCLVLTAVCSATVLLRSVHTQTAAPTNAKRLITGTHSSDWLIVAHQKSPSGLLLGPRVHMTDAKRALNEELWLAAKEGDVAKVKEKHEAGADVNWRHPWEPPGRLGQFAALHIASDQGHMEVCKYLVEKAHADLKNSGAYGETAFEHINGRTGNGREAIASYLKMKTYACQALDAFVNGLLSCPLLTSVDRTVGFLPAALCKLHWLCKSSSRCSQSPRVARRPSESTGYLDSSVTHESQSAQCCGQMRRVALDGPVDGSRTPRAYLGLDRAPLRERAHLFCVLICQFDIRIVCVFSFPFAFSRPAIWPSRPGC